ncbi:MAG: type II secretion system protein [Planctomycetes bacterium]|nr:type II secretion system protein [Planctomycetota bacterium]
MKREGFTLIELLVVIAIIVLMMAILTTVLRIIRLRAEAVDCQNNIRQISVLLTIYEQESGIFPHAFDDTFLGISPPGGFPGYFQYDRVGWWWFNDIIDDSSRKNTDKESIILCPSKKIKDIRLNNNVLCGNYGVNLSICKNSTGSRSQAEFVGTPLSISNIRQPSRSLLVMDSGYSMISWWHVTDVPPAPLVGLKNEVEAYVPGLKMNKDKTFLGAEQYWDAVNGRHPKQEVNVGYVDGHVEREKAEELFVEKTDTGYNRYPLWSPNKNNND